MGDMGSMCCCEPPEPNWYDLVFGGGTRSGFVVGVFVSGAGVQAYGYTDTGDNSVGSKFVMPRFGTRGDLASNAVTAADATGNSYAIDGFQFDLHDELVSLAGHPDAWVVSPSSHPFHWLTDPPGTGRVASVDEVIDLGDGTSFAAITTPDDTGLDADLITRLCFLNAAGAVTATVNLLSGAERAALGNDINAPNAPIQYDGVDAVKPGLLVVYEPDVSGSGTIEGLGVALITPGGVTVERTVIDASTGYSTLPTSSVPHNGVTITSATVANPLSPTGFTTTDTATVAELVGGDTVPTGSIIWPAGPRVHINSPAEPQVFVIDREVNVQTTGEWGFYGVPHRGNFWIVDRTDHYGFGRRTGPGHVATLDEELYSIVASGYAPGAGYDNHQLASQVTITRTKNGSSVSSGEYASGFGVINYYKATDAYSLAVYREVFETVAITMTGTVNTDGVDRQKYTVAYNKQVNGRKIALRDNSSGAVTKVPINTLSLEGGTVTGPPIFFDTGGVARRPHQVALTTNGAGRDVLEYVEGTPAIATTSVVYQNLLAADIWPFWGAAGADEAAYVINARWSGPGYKGSDIVLFDAAHEIIGLYRIRGTVDILNVSAQAVYVEHYINSVTNGAYLLLRDGTGAAQTQHGKRLFETVPRNDWDLPSLHPLYEHDYDDGSGPQTYRFSAGLIRHASAATNTLVRRSDLTHAPSAFMAAS